MITEIDKQWFATIVTSQSYSALSNDQQAGASETHQIVETVAKESRREVRIKLINLLGPCIISKEFIIFFEANARNSLQTRKKLRKTGESIVGLLLANGLMLWRRVWAANEPEPSEIRLKMTEPCELVCKPALALKKVNTALYSWNSNKEASSRFYVQFNRD